VEVRENPGGYPDAAGFRAALAGVDTLYLVSAAEAEDRLSQHFSAVDAAVEAGVQRIVYTSFLGASPDAVFTLVRQHAATEDRIRATGVRATFLRHSMYADFVPFFATPEDGAAVIAAPAGDGRTSFVSRDDLADVAVVVLLDDSGRFDGEALDVTGPEALTLAEAASVLTEVTGRPAVYREQTPGLGDRGLGDQLPGDRRRGACRRQRRRPGVDRASGTDRRRAPARPPGGLGPPALDPGRAVEALPDQVGVTVVPGVLLDEVVQDAAQRVLVAGPAVDAGDVEGRRGGFDVAGDRDLGLPGREGLLRGRVDRVVGDLEVAFR
jgi:hypothetical protein